MRSAPAQGEDPRAVRQVVLRTPEYPSQHTAWSTSFRGESRLTNTPGTPGSHRKGPLPCLLPQGSFFFVFLAPVHHSLFQLRGNEVFEGALFVGWAVNFGVSTRVWERH